MIIFIDNISKQKMLLFLILPLLALSLKQPNIPQLYYLEFDYIDNTNKNNTIPDRMYPFLNKKFFLILQKNSSSSFKFFNNYTENTSTEQYIIYLRQVLEQLGYQRDNDKLSIMNQFRIIDYQSWVSWYKYAFEYSFFSAKDIDAINYRYSTFIFIEDIPNPHSGNPNIGNNSSSFSSILIILMCIPIWAFITYIIYSIIMSIVESNKKDPKEVVQETPK